MRLRALLIVGLLGVGVLCTGNDTSAAAARCRSFAGTCLGTCPQPFVCLSDGETCSCQE